MTTELHSFVIAVIIGAFFLADRIGGSPELSRRLYQVALGFAIVFLLSSATTAFFRPGGQSLSEILELPASQQSSALFQANDSGDKSREAAAVKAGAGLLLLAVGFATMNRWSTVPLAVVLGGLLLLFAGGGQSGSFDVSNLTSSALFSSLFGRATEGRDIAHFVVMLVGTAVLTIFGFRRWESSNPPDSSSAGV